MAIYFQLIDQGKEVDLHELDQEICNILETPVSDIYWGGKVSDPRSFNWYDYIGFWLAAGKSLDEVKDIIVQPRLSENWNNKAIKVIDFLRKFEVKSGYTK